jgi:O-antigen ligase
VDQKRYCGECYRAANSIELGKISGRGRMDRAGKRHGRGDISHNIFITAWGEMGLPGLLVLFWLMWSVFLGTRKYLKINVGPQKDKMLAAATLAALVVAFLHAQSRPFLSNPMIPVLLAQAYTMMRLQKKQAGRSFVRERKMSVFKHKPNRESL